MAEKKALSAVISTLLLVLITITAIVILASFVFPLVRDSLAKGKECYDMKEYFSVKEEDSCYMVSEKYAKLSIERKYEKRDVRGINIGFSCSGESKTYKIIPGNPAGNVKMFNSPTADISLPEPGEIRLYRFENAENCNSGRIVAILNSENSCEPFQFELSAC